MTSIHHGSFADSHSKWMPAISRWSPTVAVVSLLVLLVLVPVGFLLLSSFKPDGSLTEDGFTLANYATVYLDAEFWGILWQTCVFVVGSTAAALVLGTGLAWLVERTDLPYGNVIRIFIILPLATPPLLLAIAWLMLLSPRSGVLNQWLMSLFGLETAPLNISSMGGMIFVEALALVPTVFLMMAPAFRRVDPSLEEAALMAGASTWTIVRRIMLPILRPTLLASTVFLAIVGFVVFDIPGTLGMPVRVFVLSSQIYYLIGSSPAGVPAYGQVSAIATLFLVMLVSLALVYQRLTSQSHRFVTITGKSFRPRRFVLGRSRWIGMLFVGIYFLLAIILPLGILVWTSLMPYQGPVSWDMASSATLSNHREFLSNPSTLKAVFNSLVVAVISATVVAMLSVVIGWLVVRSTVPGRRVIDILSFLPIAVPGIMMGVALMYVYLTVQIVPIYGTIWILVIAYITSYLAFGSRSAQGVMFQLHRELEEAAEMAGASRLRIFWRITLRLTMPAFVAIWIWVLAHVVRELSTALILHGRYNTVVSTLIWDYWTNGGATGAAAISVWLIAALALLLGFSQFLGRKNQLS
ncbi:ABC transporter permease [Variovorax boronicumulans]|uniref:ABC transporter permease n=1 Tax=Variovorax boronicumulans TaxID=436515 RepID=UPI001C58C22E